MKTCIHCGESGNYEAFKYCGMCGIAFEEKDYVSRICSKCNCEVNFQGYCACS